MELSSITDQNLHALAIDEYREPFEATVWRRSQFKQFNTVTEQVWFPGAHADVGGGYIIQENRHGGSIDTLDDLTLSWMIKRVKARYDVFQSTILRTYKEVTRMLRSRLSIIRGQDSTG